MVASIVTAAEQYQLELINRARLDPVAEAARLGINLNEGLAAGTISTAAKQPLAGLSASALHDVAVDHTLHMISVDQFGHEGIGDGTTQSRIDGMGIVWSALGENIAATSSTNEALNTTKLYENLFKDAGIAGRGHRLNILDNDFDEAGIGIRTGVFNPGGGGSTLVTQDFVGSSRVFFTGVAYNDTNNNKFYDIGEARANVVVTSGASTGQSGAAGGYAIDVALNTLQFSGGGLATPVNVTVTGTAGENIKVDLVGTNTIYSSANTTLGAGAANLTLLGFNGNTGTGNDVANTIVGTRGNNVLFGLGGVDTLFGGDGNDVLHGGIDNDKLNGEKGTDRLLGGAGADALNGGDGSDTAMYLGSAAVTVSLATPSLNTGDALGDTFISIENLTGSQFGDVLTGNADANILMGVNGDDRLFGLGGADSIRGDAGNDVLDGGAGADALSGGTGFNFASYESATAAVIASMDPGATGNTGDAAGDTYNLIQGLVGTKFSDTLTGDSNGNILNGGALNDKLNGGGGIDLLEGGLGRDMLDGGDDFDSATYGLATARVTANLANSALNTGEALGDTYNSIEGLGGSNFNDKLTGNTIGNIINGGFGNDTLAGGAGADAFIFNTALNTTTNVDTITDFSVVDDVFWLENTGVFGKLTTPGSLNAANFKIGSAATDANDFIVYNKTTGDIFYDADGNGTGTAIKFAHVNANTALTDADFLVI